MNAARLARVYGWVLTAAVLIMVALNSTPTAQGLDSGPGWEVLPDACTTPTACTPNNPTR